MLSLDQLSPEYNFKYGVCKLYASEDKEEAIKYLKFAASKNADNRVNFYLGKAYHLNYRFQDALNSYQKYKSKADPKEAEKYHVDRHIKMCNSGKKLLNSLTELVVEDKTNTTISNFPYSYDFTEMGGRILITEQFQSKYDEKNGYRSMTYFPPRNQGQDVIFYSSYGKNGENGLDLYAVKLLPNGEWGEPQILPPHINTPYDDAYGFLHSSGNYFYFCSKGHNSMGGYDVFKSSYVKSTNSFGPPVNLDYKINTPDDDLMYIVDSLEKNAFFASARASKGGYVDVYKVRVETFPIVNVLLAGNFDNQIFTGDKATIKVKDPKDGEIIGVYNPNTENSYIILLPKAGTYEFIVETEQSSKIHTSTVIIPPQSEFKALKQRIILENSSGQEKVIIKNLFDEEVEGAEGIMAQVLKMMANPEVNASDYQDQLQETVDSVLGADINVAVEDLEGMSREIFEDAQEEADQLKKDMEAAYYVADKKTKYAQDLAAQRDEIMADIDKLENPLEKQQQASLAKEINKKAQDAYKQATTAYNLAAKKEEAYNNAQQEADESKKTYEAIQKALSTDDSQEAIALLKDLQEQIKNDILTGGEDDVSFYNELEIKAQEASEKAQVEFTKAQEFRDEEQKLKLRLKGLKSDLEKAKKKDQPSIQVKIDDLNEQIAMNKTWGDEAFEKAEKLDFIAKNLAEEVMLMKNLAEELESTDEVLSDEELAALSTTLEQESFEENLNDSDAEISQYIPEGEDTSSTEETETAATTEVSEDVDEVITAAQKSISEDSYSAQLSDQEYESEEEQATEENSVYQNWVDDIDDKIQTIDAELSTASDAEKAALNEVKESLLSKKSEINNKIEVNNQTLADSNTSDNTNEIVSKFTNAVEELDQSDELVALENAELSAADKAEQTKQVLNNWNENLETQLSEIENTLDNSDEDNLELEDLKTEIETQIAENKQLLSAQEEILAQETESPDAISTEQISTFQNNIVLADQSDELSGIENSNRTDKEKAELKKQLLETWNSILREELSAVNSTMQENPAEAEKLNGLKDQIENQIAENDQTIEEQENLLAEENSTVASSNSIESIRAAVEESNQSSEITKISNQDLAELDRATLENQVYENWKDDLDDQLNDINTAILASSGEEKNALITLRDETTEQKRFIEQSIDRNNEIIATNTSVTANEEITAIENEITDESATADDFETDLTETGTYRSESAADELENTSTDREELILKQDELLELEQEYEEESKEKKKDKLATKIEDKQEEITELESDIAESFIRANQAEMDYVEEDLAESLEEVKNSTPNYENEKNYVKAAKYNELANKQYLAADSLVDVAGSTTNEEEKVALLKKANQLEQAGASNKKEADFILEEMLEEDYQNEYIGEPTLAVNNTSETTDTETTDTETTDTETTDTETTDTETTDTETTDTETADTETTDTETTDTETTDTETTDTETTDTETTDTETTDTETTDTETTDTETTDTETTDTETTDTETTDTETTDTETTDTETTDTETTNTKITSIETVNTTAISVEEVNNGVAELDVVVSNSIKKGQEQVEDQTVLDKTYSGTNTEPEIYDVTTEVPDMEYTKALATEVTAGTEIMEGTEKVLDKIQDYQVEKTQLNAEAANVSSDKDREKVEKKNDKLDKKIANQELKIDESVQQLNQAKVSAAKDNLKQVKISFGELVQDENYLIAQSKEYENTGDELLAEAEDLRAEAENTKDNTEKSELLKNANSKEAEAANNFDKAANLYIDGVYDNLENNVSSAKISEDIDISAVRENADALKEQADNLYELAAAQQDSALLAKDEEKIAILNRADANQKKAQTLSSASGSLNDLAEKAEDTKANLAYKENLVANLTADDAKAVKSNERYEEYYDNMTKAGNYSIEIGELEGEKLGYENIVKQQESYLNALKNRLKEAEINEKDEVENEIEILETKISENEDEIERLENEIETLSTEKSNVEIANTQLINDLDPELQSDFEAMAYAKVDKTPIEVLDLSPENLASANFEVPEKLESDIIVLNNDIKYSDDNPIPLDPKYPDGLIYKVQVGAFSKPIPNDVFSGFAPISGEKVGNLVRYRVGYFLDYTKANEVKNEIRGIGYSDAFVVAIYNGDRISLAEARDIQVTGPEIATNNTTNNTNDNQQTDNNIAENNTNTEETNNTSTTDNTANNTTETTENNNQEVNNAIEVNLGDGTARTNDADKIEGLFYTVQLGAFSSPVEANDVYNISPLVTKFIGNLYKYSTGIFRSLDEANQRKNQVIQLGNSDAFVTVYYNGEKISVAEAQRLINENGEDVFATTADGNFKQLSERANMPDANATGSYRVDLGTFSGEAPTDIANAMLLIQKYEVNTEETAQGTYYYVGNFDSEADAQKVVDLYNDNGVESISIQQVNTDGSNSTNTQEGPSAIPGLEYRVWLGEYEGEVSGARAIVFMELDALGISREQQNGKDVYYSGNEDFFKDADEIRKQFANKGVSIAEVRAYQNGQQISIEEAKELTGEE